MPREWITKGYGIGVHDLLPNEQIPGPAASKSYGWISQDGKIELSRGRFLIGAEETGSGFVKGEGFGYRADGTSVHFRKINTRIQYYNSATSLWVDIVTGLTASEEYTFSPYTSPAGTFMIATGADGLYKIHVANPGSYVNLYDATKNYLCRSFIDKGRMFAWNISKNKAAIFHSWKDALNNTIVSAEVLGSGNGVLVDFSGTLAFKGGDAKRTCYNISITAGAEIFTDDKNGNFTSPAGGTGTINYTTGAWAIHCASAPANSANNITGTYQWEMSNNQGITDFTYSATRLAGEGSFYLQDYGGEGIQKALPFNGSYISIKGRSVYQLTIADNDLSAKNDLFSIDIGMQYFRSAVATTIGIVYMDTANPDKPQLKIIKKNLTGDNLISDVLANHFNFANYLWDACAMDTFGETIIFSGRTPDSLTNNRFFIYNARLNSVDVLNYGVKTTAKDAGLLYIGSSFNDNIYQLLSEWDDDGDTIENSWIGNGELMKTERLKKVKQAIIKGQIVTTQKLQVWCIFDDDAAQLVGTILGNGSYVDTANPFTISSSILGESRVGGESDSVIGYNYMCPLKLKTPKFRKRTLMFVATGVGYVSVEQSKDFDIKLYKERLPKRFRQKQNVSLDGATTNQPNP